MTLIDADNSFGLLTIFLALAAFGFWSERTRIGQILSGVILVILIGLLLSTFRVIPFDAPFYGVIWGYAVPLAIPLLLFRADLKRIIPTAGPMLISFVIAVIGTVVGVIAGFNLIDLGTEGPRIASIIGASWIGGSVNFAATSQSLGMDDQSLLSGMAAADNVGAILFLLVLVALPAQAAVRRILPSAIIENTADESAELEEDDGESLSLHMVHIAVLLALSALCCFLGYGTAALLGNYGTGAGIDWLAGFSNYGILFITIYALIIANLFPERMHSLHGDFQLGMLLMYIFFGVMGAGADILIMIEKALPIFAFVGIMATVHLVIVLTATKLLKIDLAEALIVSNTVALGPAAAAAQAASQRWNSLVTPGVMLGVLGYAVANFIGVVMAGWLAGG